MSTGSGTKERTAVIGVGQTKYASTRGDVSMAVRPSHVGANGSRRKKMRGYTAASA